MAMAGNSAMMKLYHVMLLCFLLIATSSQAGIRVLFEFNVNGLRVHQVFESASNNNSPRDGLGPRPGDATIYWLDETGVELAKSFLADPRFSHAPWLDGENRHEAVIVREGAWLANGPDGARSATLFLPAHPDAGLSELIWTVLLP